MRVRQVGVLSIEIVVSYLDLCVLLYRAWVVAAEGAELSAAGGLYRGYLFAVFLGYRGVLKCYSVVIGYLIVIPEL